jgi:hypothetical protein
MKLPVSGLVALGFLCLLFSSVTSAVSQTNQPADEGLIYHWTFSEPLEKGSDAFIGNLAGVPDIAVNIRKISCPDQVGVRKMELHFTTPERKHDWEEQIVLLPPGKYPKDVIDKESITLVNIKGETAG